MDHHPKKASKNQSDNANCRNLKTTFLVKSLTRKIRDNKIPLYIWYREFRVKSFKALGDANMLIIPRNTPKKSKGTYKSGELRYYQSLEAEFRQREAKKMAKTSTIDNLQALSDRSLTQAIKEAIDPKNAIPPECLEIEESILKNLYGFQDRRNAVPSPRWENELKAKFGKGT
jgi:hypothetical protein